MSPVAAGTPCSVRLSFRRSSPTFIASWRTILTTIFRRLRLFAVLLLIAGVAMAADRAVKCIWCNGTGKRVSGKSCESCSGTGTRWEQIPGGKDGAGREQAAKCIWCNGSGKQVSGKVCGNCGGTGVRWEQPAGNNKQAVKCIWCSGTGKRV